MHCKLSGGLARKDLKKLQAHAHTTDIGLWGDSVKLSMALAAYLLGHGEVGLWLASDSKHGDGSRVIMGEQSNLYMPWIRSYSGGMYQGAVEMA